MFTLKTPFSYLQALTSICLMAFFAGCAVNVTPVTGALNALPEPGKQATFVLDRQIDIRLDTGYDRSLKAGSEWTHVGRIDQGNVYKPHNGVFTLEGKHVHEAWLVVANGRLAGFYLPVEQGFSPVTGTFEIPLSSTRNNKEQ